VRYALGVSRMSLDEAALRDLLGADGLLDPAREVAFPSRESAFTVFSQRAGARLDVGEWGRHAERFFGARLGLTVDKRYAESAPERDVARVALATKERAREPAMSGARVCWSRPRTDDDLDAARAAEAAGAGLTDLAARCPQVWLIESEGDGDRLALLLAGIVAGVLLGPIVTPRGAELFGPKTARLRLGV
jgi:hypothetical protein